MRNSTGRTRKPRYYVQAQRRTPSPTSSVSYYCVVDRGAERDGKPAVTNVHRYSVKQYGEAEARYLANLARDDLNAGIE